MGQEGAIVAVGVVVCMIMITMAVVEFIHGADHIALSDGKNSLYASKGREYW